MFSFSTVAAESDFDIKVRKETKMPSEWFTCKSSVDCGLAYTPCGPSLAVNMNHKTKAQGAICKTWNCQVGCDGSAIDNSYAVCDEGQCVTKTGSEKDKAAAELNAVYKKLVMEISLERQAELAEAEKAWGIYRAKQCEFDVLGTVDESMRPMIDASCYSYITNQHTDTLRQELNCQEGNGESVFACGKKR